MSYVDPSLRSTKVLGSVTKAADEGDIAALVAILFGRKTLAAFQQHGLARNYYRVRVNQSLIRGRIDFAEATRRGGLGPRMPCLVWERLPDTPLNRLLCEATRRITMMPHLRKSVPRELAELRGILAGVTASVDPDLLSGKRPLTRTELPYEGPCALARLIVRSTSLTEGRQSDSIAFKVNLERLFEQAVATAFREAGLEVQASKRIPYTIATPKSGEKKRAMEMDVYLPKA